VIVRRFLDTAFIVCNLLAVGFFAVSFIKSEVNAQADTTVLGAYTEVPAPQYAEQQLAQLAKQINNVRATNNLQPFTQSSTLDAVAEARATDMSMHAYYAHKSPSGKLFDDIMADQGTKNIGFACENLNMAETSAPDAFIKSWLDSPSHKQCLLDGRTKLAGYAITKVLISNGVPINQYVVVAIYSE
jgi:uncharacterized protein YkwD